MACVAIVVFDINSMRFSDHMPLWRQDFRESIPIVGVESAPFQMPDLFIEASKGCGITIPEHQATVLPVRRSMALTTQSLFF